MTKTIKNQELFSLLPLWIFAGMAVLGLSAWLLAPVEFVAASFGPTSIRQELSFGIHLDRLSGTVSAFIASIGAVVYAFSRRQLAGEDRSSGFMTRLIMVVVAAYLQALSPGLGQFALGWILVSVGLDGLLRTENQRPLAIRSASMKFWFSRAGDVAMLVAIFSPLVSNLSITPYLMVIAVAIKTACFPLHGWLIGSLEAPTPVSALLHAGIINSGGLLLLRFPHHFQEHADALSLLILIVLPSIVLGPLAMWTQTDYKRSLAWSTVGQMSFMLLQCALGGFGSALLHLFGHGIYKANAFLRSGTLEGMMEKPLYVPSRGNLLAGMLTGFGCGLIGLGCVYAWAFRDIGAMPGGWSLFVIQALAVMQLAVSPASGRQKKFLIGTIGILGGLLYAGATLAMETLFAGNLGVITPLELRGTSGIILLIGVLMSLGTLILAWSGHRWWTLTAWGKSLLVAASHGFYLNPCLPFRSPQVNARIAANES